MSGEPMPGYRAGMCPGILGDPGQELVVDGVVHEGMPTLKHLQDDGSTDGAF